MSKAEVQKPNLEGAEHLTLVIGLSCRGPLGFLYMWMNIASFIWATKTAPGCTEVLPGISGPFAILLVSYWESSRDMMRFVGSPSHKRWMRFINRFPGSLNLFNETYGRPQRANYINRPRGYAASVAGSQRNGSAP